MWTYCELAKRNGRGLFSALYDGPGDHGLSTLLHQEVAPSIRHPVPTHRRRTPLHHRSTPLLTSAVNSEVSLIRILALLSSRWECAGRAESGLHNYVLLIRSLSRSSLRCNTKSVAITVEVAQVCRSFKMRISQLAAPYFWFNLSSL